MKICPKCNKVWDDSWGVCFSCHAELLIFDPLDSMVCTKCEKIYPSDYKLCASCGIPLSKSENRKICPKCLEKYASMQEKCVKCGINLIENNEQSIIKSKVCPKCLKTFTEYNDLCDICNILLTNLTDEAKKVLPNEDTFKSKTSSVSSINEPPKKEKPISTNPAYNKGSGENKHKGLGVVGSIVSVIVFVAAGMFGKGVRYAFQGSSDAGPFMLFGLILGGITIGGFLLYAKASTKK